ncbi:MAG: hypothetical protein IV100_00670 [Myxococcales bacterium]|nr:hypothetical protein [Myxococcales bacterium]
MATLHRDASAAGRNTYVDPATGFNVFTEQSHLDRGYCCGSGCRHCPFGHARVPDRLRTARGHARTQDPS